MFIMFIMFIIFIMFIRLSISNNNIINKTFKPHLTQYQNQFLIIYLQLISHHIINHLYF
jgi:hypothetical protein